MKSVQISFFDERDRFGKIDKLKDPLVELASYIDFEMFRSKLEEVFTAPKRSSAGRKPMDAVMMFKILILQRLYNLSDEQIEFQINDRLTFCRFIGLPLGAAAPDFTTVWRFREALVKADAVKPLFDLFGELLERKGLITRAGTIVDASFVEVPKQRNTKEENELVKKGVVPEQWRTQPRKLAQKDVDARWTSKGGARYFGYKNHAKADAESKLVTDYAVTDASVHDSQKLLGLLGDKCGGENIFADSAYAAAALEEGIRELKATSYIHERAYRGRPLTEGQKSLNALKSKIRCLVEHIFGYIENSMGGPELRYIGMARNAAGVGLCNLAYNMKRYVFLSKPKRRAAA